MAGPNHILDKGFRAMATTAQWQCVKLVTSAKEQMTPVTGTGDRVLGICQDDVAAADAGRQIADVRTIGWSYAIAGAAVAIDDDLIVTAAGRLIPKGAAAAGTRIVAIAQTAGAADGDIIVVFLTPGAKV